MTRDERMRVALEALALALVTALPLLAYFVYLFHHPIDRFALSGDYAGLELATRYVPSGRALLGPYSRFGFSHPGRSTSTRWLRSTRSRAARAPVSSRERAR